MQSMKNIAVFAIVASAVFTLGAPQAAVGDCNGNGIPDECDIACGSLGGMCDVAGCGVSTDCNANGIPDQCEIDSASTAPGGPYFCDSADPPAPLTECDPDCNNNGCPDECDLAPSIAFSQAPSLSVDNDSVNWITALASTVAGPQVPVDLNNDTHTDLIVLSLEALSLSVFLGHGDGEFDDRVIYPLLGNFPVMSVVGDCDNDGHMDVVVNNRGDTGPGDFLSLFRNSGDGTGRLLPEVAIPLGFTSSKILFVDLDRDGLLDLISLTGFDSIAELRLLRNLGGCTFAAPVVCVTEGGLAIGVMVAADFNNDTWPDLSVPRQLAGDVLVFLNSATGVFDCTLFGAPNAYPTGDSPASTTAADMDGDTHVDIVVSNAGEVTGMASITILWNNGDGTSFSPRSYPGGLHQVLATIADLDNDGDQEVASGMNLALPPFILENLGGRNFAPAKGFTGATGPGGEAIAAGDFNEDGRADLTEGQSNVRSVNIFLNDFGPLSTDCNANGVPDKCDIADCLVGDASCQDCNLNEVPDGCEGGPFGICPNDCSGNGFCDCDTCICDAGWTGADCSTPTCEGACVCSIVRNCNDTFTASEGGCLVLEVSGFEFCVEPGDLAEDTPLCATEDPINDPDVDVRFGPSPGLGTAVGLFDLQTDGLVFASPITLTIRGDVSDLNANQQSRLDLFFLDETSNKFESINADCCVDEDPPGVFTSVCSAEISHFST